MFWYMYTLINRHLNQDVEHFQHPKSLLVPFGIIAFLPRQPLICFQSLQVSLHFLEFHTNGVVQHILLLVWLPSAQQHDLSSIHFVAHINNSFTLFIAWQYSIVQTHNLFFHSSVDGHCGCFQFEVITKKAAMNICVQVFV